MPPPKRRGRKAAAEEDARKTRGNRPNGKIRGERRKSARRELKAYAADLAVSMAIKQIKVDSVTDQGLIRLVPTSSRGPSLTVLARTAGRAGIDAWLPSPASMLVPSLRGC